MTKTFFSSLFAFFCFLIIEVAILSNIIILPSVPDLMLIVTLFVALHNGTLIGETTGFCSGLMIDFLSSGPFGLNCLLRTIIGFVTGLFSKSINTNGFFIPALLGFCGTIFKAIMLTILSFFFPGDLIQYSLISLPGCFELIANTILTPFIFMLLRVFSSYLILDPEKIR